MSETIDKLLDELRRVTAVVEIASTHPHDVDLVKASHDLTMVGTLLEAEITPVGWRPIETAPKSNRIEENKRVWLAFKEQDGSWNVERGAWRLGLWVLPHWETEFGREVTPVFWQPFIRPSPPETASRT